MKLNRTLLNKLVKQELRRALTEADDLEFSEADMESVGAGGFDFIPREVKIDGMRVLDLNNFSDIDEARSKARELGMSHFIFNNKKDDMGRPMVHSTGYADQQLDSLSSALDPNDPDIARDAARIGLSGLGDQRPLNKPSRGGGYDPRMERDPAGDSRMADSFDFDSPEDSWDADDFAADADLRADLEGTGIYDGPGMSHKELVHMLSTDPDSEMGRAYSGREAGVDKEMLDIMKKRGYSEQDVRDITGVKDFKTPKSFDDDIFDFGEDSPLSESLISYFSPKRSTKKKIKTKFYRR